MFILVKELVGVMNGEQRRKLYILQFFVVLSAMLEMIGVLSIGPFMAMVGNVEIINQNKYIYFLYTGTGFEDPMRFLTSAGIVVLAVMFLSSLISIITIWKLSLFAAGVGSEFGDRLYHYYIKKNYLFHTSINSSELIKKIATEVNRVTDNVLQPFVQINARLASVVFISIFIFFYNPYVAVSGIVILSLSYFILYKSVRNKLSINGGLISEYSKKRFSLMNEGFGAIKEVQILGRESFFVKQFELSGKHFSNAYGTSNGLYNMPRYLMEFIVYSAMIALIIALLQTNDGQVSAVLPVIGVFGIAALKMLPSFQQIYSGAAQIRSNHSAFNAIKEDLLNAQKASKTEIEKERLTLKGDIVVDNAVFSYSGKKTPAVNKVNLTIPFRTSVGIVGPSGSGKSTLLDILVGAIELDEGKLIVGDKVIDESSIRSWRNSIGYVSQISLLKDGSIAENIAFGYELNEINEAKLKQAAEMAQLLSWVESLPDGLDTQIGERGLQISGGQRQRIAIARALYNDAEYLFFDEATSALDGITEKNIMESISGMAGLKTVVMIAHRLNTVKDCDNIYVISNGCIDAEGTFSFLIEENDYFKNMAGATK